MSERVTCTARVQLVVEIDCTQPWGPETMLPEVYKTAAREALDRLRGHPWPMRVIGDPIVKAVIVEQP